MIIPIGILFIIMILLAYQYAQMSERRKSRFSHTWFSRSKLFTHRMKWWKWMILSLLVFLGCLFITGFGQHSRGLLLILPLFLIYMVFMKPIQRFSSSRKRRLGEALLILILICLTFLGYEIFNYSPEMPEEYLLFQGTRFWKNLFLFVLPNFIWIMLVIYMVRYYTTFVVNKRQEKALRLARLKTQLTSAQLEALQTRINPHFLYNALNSIAGLALTDGDSTRRMALALSRFFSYCSDPKASPIITIREEIEIATTYLEIEKIRFGDKIEFQTHISPEANTARVPRLSLQPLVENAVKHGMHSDIPVLHITIRAWCSAGQLFISVQDNGHPFPGDLLPGYGLKSIYDRLDILFPNQYEINLKNTPQKEVLIMIKVLQC